MPTRTISAAGGNVNSTAAWDEGVLPTSSDDLVARSDGTSGNLTINTTLALLTADFTHYSGNLIHNASVNLQIAGTLFKLSPTMTYVAGRTARLYIQNSSGTALITTAGKQLGGLYISGAGTKQLQDVCTVQGGFQRISGALDQNGHALIISISDTTGTRFFDGGGQAYGVVIIGGVGSSAVAFSGSNTFTSLEFQANTTVRFTAGTTTTAENWTFGANCNIVGLTNATYTLASTGTTPIVALNATITNSIASPANTFYAPGGTLTNTTGWNASYPPAGSAIFFGGGF